MLWPDSQLQDLLPFAPETYWRLIERANRAAWPVPLGIPLLLASGLALRWCGGRIRSYLIAGLLAGAWIWCGGYFVGRWYTSINGWAAYAVPVCCLQALLVAWFGTVRSGFACLRITGVRQVVGCGLALGALLAYPLTALARGQAVTGGEFAGTAPDPTAVATLGLCLMTRRAGAWICLPVPLLACGIGFLTLRAMDSWQAGIPLAAAITGGVLATVSGRQGAVR